MIKKNYYPNEITITLKIEIINDCIKEYKNLLRFKPFNANINLLDNLCIEFIVDDEITIFDLKKRKIIGETNNYAEDFRDFLRYRGIKIFNNKPFRSIIPNWYKQAFDNESILHDI